MTPTVFTPAGSDERDHKKNIALLDYLENFVTSHKREKMRSVLSKRTRYFTLVLENLYQSHNSSAALRTCDCFGIQDVHIISDKYAFQLNDTIASGSVPWLSLNYYQDKAHNNYEQCAKQLKAAGYRLVATTPDVRGYSVLDLPINQKTALWFGTEEHGLSEQALALADDFVTIPIGGFTESLNVSVSVAVVIFELTRRMTRERSIHWQLNEFEKTQLQINWCKQIVPRGDLLERRFMQEHGS